MKVIIAGSRNAKVSMGQLWQAIEASGFILTEIISGHSGNADLLGEDYAKINDIPLTLFPADWKNGGRKAGPLRNRLMADNADALIALWDGNSPGTLNMIKEATRRELSVYVMNV